MNIISKVSDITYEDIADYIRLVSPDENEINTLKNLIEISKQFILTYTGIKKVEDLDKYNDLIIVIFILCQDMYDNRTLYVDNSNLNKVVHTILNMHLKNFL